MQKLKRLTIHKFRNVKPGVTVEFNDGLNILLGRNGSGKTTFLNLVSMILRDDLSGLANEEFKIEYELSDGNAKCHAVVVNRAVASPTAEVQSALFPSMLPDFEATADLRFRSRGRRTVNVTSRGRAHSFAGHSSPKEHWWSPTSRFYRFLSSLEVSLNRPWPPEFAALRFDESLDLFRRIHSAPDGELRLAATQAYRSTGGTLVPPFVADSLLRVNVEEKHDLSLKKNQVPQLALFTTEAELQDAELRSQLIGETTNRGETTCRFSPPTLYCTLHDGLTKFTQDHLSYGQKRLWTFLYYLACNPDVVIADELVNGLHHRWIKLCVSQIGERQAFLTSQNPLLFDYVPMESAEDIRTRFILCRTEAGDGQHGMVWENMGQAKAVELHDAYDAGIEQVGEMLQSRGLW